MTNTRVLTDHVTLTVNGREHSIPAGSTLGDLLGTLDIDPRTVVVEHNREILRDRSSLPERALAEGDTVEIVHFVGGG